jgi:hypothetical protein
MRYEIDSKVFFIKEKKLQVTSSVIAKVERVFDGQGNESETLDYYITTKGGDTYGLPKDPSKPPYLLVSNVYKRGERDSTKECPWLFNREEKANDVLMELIVRKREEAEATCKRFQTKEKEIKQKLNLF